MRIPSIAVALTLFATLCSADLPSRKFAFQSIELDSLLEAVPTPYKSDCGSGNDSKYIFCHFKTDVGAIPMAVDLWFDNRRLANINAYFPIDQYDVVALALREKYGQEVSRTPDAMVWFASKFIVGAPTPDKLTLKRQPSYPKTPDGKYIQGGVKYGAIEYESYWDANEITRRLNEEHDRKVKGVAEKL